MFATLEMRKFVAPEFVIGNNSRLLAGRYAKNLGATNVSVIADQTSSKWGGYGCGRKP